MASAIKRLAVIPARTGSKGLPGKNVRPFAGVPLIAHTILFAKGCPQVTRCIVSTDSSSIADVARQFGAEVPFLRPEALAQDDTPLWPVLRHALAMAEAEDGQPYDELLLLDPTSPARTIEDVTGALRRLHEAPSADGVVSVSRPEFNPVWHCVVEQDGWMADLIPGGGRITRRQDAPVVYRINGALYIWRTRFLRAAQPSWRTGRHVIYEIPESRAISIDTLEAFERAELLVKSGMIAFPWMQGQHASR